MEIIIRSKLDQPAHHKYNPIGNTYEIKYELNLLREYNAIIGAPTKKEAESLLIALVPAIEITNTKKI